MLKSVLRQGVEEFCRSNPINESVLSNLFSSAHYICSSFNEVEGYQILANWLETNQVPNSLFYLATPPDSYTEIIDQIGKVGLAKSTSSGWRRNHC